MAARLKRATRCPGPGAVPFLHRLNIRLSILSIRASPLEDNPAASLNDSSLAGKSGGNRDGSTRYTHCCRRPAILLPHILCQAGGPDSFFCVDRNHPGQLPRPSNSSFRRMSSPPGSLLARRTRDSMPPPPGQPPRRHRRICLLSTPMHAAIPSQERPEISLMAASLSGKSSGRMGVPVGNRMG